MKFNCYWLYALLLQNHIYIFKVPDCTLCPFFTWVYLKLVLLYSKSIKIQSNMCTTTTLGTQSGRSSEVALCYKTEIRTSRRTTADQEVLALIAPLGKLIVTNQLEKKSAASSKRPSLLSGAIRANTSCSALVLLGDIKNDGLCGEVVATRRFAICSGMTVQVTLLFGDFFIRGLAFSRSRKQ